MKYLSIIIAVMAFIGSATATSSLDCCGGGACCGPSMGCCAK